MLVGYLLVSLQLLQIKTLRVKEINYKPNYLVGTDQFSGVEPEGPEPLIRPTKSCL
jgi:hypothetical protein